MESYINLAALTEEDTIRKEDYILSADGLIKHFIQDYEFDAESLPMPREAWLRQALGLMDH